MVYPCAFGTAGPATRFRHRCRTCPLGGWHQFQSGRHAKRQRAPGRRSAHLGHENRGLGRRRPRDSPLASNSKSRQCFRPPRCAGRRSTGSADTRRQSTSVLRHLQPRWRVPAQPARGRTGSSACATPPPCDRSPLSARQTGMDGPGRGQESRRGRPSSPDSRRIVTANNTPINSTPLLRIWDTAAAGSCSNFTATPDRSTPRRLQPRRGS